MSENNKTTFETPVLTVLQGHEFDQNIPGNSTSPNWLILDIPELS